MGNRPAEGKVQPRDWSVHIWEGLDLFAWLRLLRDNHFAVGLPYLYVAGAVSAVSFGHTALRFLQEALYRDRIKRTPIRHAPLFVIGHWRSGTTLLHELLVLDERHA